MEISREEKKRKRRKEEKRQTKKEMDGLWTRGHKGERTKEEGRGRQTTMEDHD